MTDHLDKTDASPVSGRNAHLFSSATHHVSRRWKPPAPSVRHAVLLSSLLVSPTRLLHVECFARLCLCTWPVHSISSTTLNSNSFCTVQPIPLCDTLTHLPPPTAAEPVTCRLRGTQKPFSNLLPSFLTSFLSCPSLMFLSFSPSSLPLTFHSCPLSVLWLPLSPLPLPNHYQFSLTHYLLLAPCLSPPLPLSPPLSIPVADYPPYISSPFALPSPHLQQHEYIIIYTMGPCLLFMNYQPCGQTKPIFIRNLHFISAPIRLGAKE